MSPVVDPAAFIAPGAVVLGDVQIGADSSVWYYTVIRGDTERIRIGDGTNLQDFTMVHADPGIPCLVGHRVTVGHRVILHGCIVEDECLIGMGAILLNGAKVGQRIGRGRRRSFEGGDGSPARLARGRITGQGVTAGRREEPGAHRPDLAALRRAGQAASSRGVSDPATEHRDELIRPNATISLPWPAASSIQHVAGRGHQYRLGALNGHCAPSR